MKQSELIKQMSNQELKKSLLLSQLLLLFIAFTGSLFVFDSFHTWLNYFSLDVKEIIYYGLFSGIVIVIIDLVLMFVFPKKYYDDGGINVRIFSSLTVREIFFICVLIALSEELLFRGVIQTTFGYLIASIVFALVHIRYLKKPILLISVLLVSFYIGYLFKMTENLYVTIFAHFIVDFLLGMMIHFKSEVFSVE